MSIGKEEIPMVVVAEMNSMQQKGHENYIGNITGNFFHLSNGDHLVTLLQAPHSILNTKPVTKEFAVWSAADEAFGRGQYEIWQGFTVELNF